jgi:hypothetical protein
MAIGGRGTARTAWIGLIVVASLVFAGRSSHAQAEPPVLLGIYSNGTFYDSSGPQEVQAINAWIGDPSKRLSIGATFSGLDHANPSFNVPVPLEGIWKAGLVPFVNISANRSAREIAQGAIDANLVAWADAFKTWVTQPGGRRAFLAPLQEMNGNWAPWGQDPVQFKLAYNRIRSILAQRGVPANTVRWVFAPNGWSPPGHEFERYYPGNANVDVVAISAYNFGACVWQFPTWDTFATAMKPSLGRMRAMAPSKPIFIAQTGSVSWGGDKNAWLDDTYTQLAAYPALRAILYYHLNQVSGLPCDPVEWRLYAPGAGVVFPGVRDAVLRPAAGFGHWAPTDGNWLDVAFTDGPRGLFDDVQPAHPFAGVPNVFYYDAVRQLVAAGVTGGCSAAPPLFCPDQRVSREQMAVFLLKAKESGSYSPPACGSPIFADVSCASPFAAWIQELVRRRITAGCGPQLYCPSTSVTREQMAVFLLRTLEGPTYQPPACSVATFTDVPCGSPFAAWIQELVRRRITAGCRPTAYCPTSSVTRGQMAVFLVRTFNLQ